MSKNELEQIYHLSKEVEMWQRELYQYECESEIKGKGTAVKTKKDIDIIGKRLATKERCKTIIKGKLAEIESKREEILRFIDSIEDSQMRQIIFYRNYSLMSWREVANHVGAGYTAESVRQAYGRFFKNR